MCKAYGGQYGYNTVLVKSESQYKSANMLYDTHRKLKHNIQFKVFIKTRVILHDFRLLPETRHYQILYSLKSKDQAHTLLIKQFKRHQTKIDIPFSG